MPIRRGLRNSVRQGSRSTSAEVSSLLSGPSITHQVAFVNLPRRVTPHNSRFVTRFVTAPLPSQKRSYGCHVQQRKQVNSSLSKNQALIS